MSLSDPLRKEVFVDERDLVVFPTSNFMLLLSFCVLLETFFVNLCMTLAAPCALLLKSFRQKSLYKSSTQWSEQGWKTLCDPAEWELILKIQFRDFKKLSRMTSRLLKSGFPTTAILFSMVRKESEEQEQEKKRVTSSPFRFSLLNPLPVPAGFYFDRALDNVLL